MDVKSSNLLFWWMFLLIVWPTSQKIAADDDDVQKENMLEITSESDWPKIAGSGADSSPFYAVIFPEGSSDALKFGSELLSNHSDDLMLDFSFKYWMGREEEFRFIDPKNYTKVIKLQTPSGYSFKTSQPNDISLGDLKTMYLKPPYPDRDHSLFLKEVKISDFTEFHTNFDVDSTDRNVYRFNLKGNCQKALLHEIFDCKDDQFKKICFQIKLPAKSELYLSIEDDPHVKQLQFDLFNNIPEYICLRDILAMDPNRRFMFIVKVLEAPVNQTDENFVRLKLDSAKEFKPQRPGTEVENNWIYNDARLDYYDLELKSANTKAEFLACDTMAQCFRYETRDHIKFKLSDDDRNKLKNSPIIRRLAFHVNGTEYKVGDSLANQTISWLQNKIEITGSKNHTFKPNDAQVTITIEPQANNSEITLMIPYIDLRSFDPTIKLTGNSFHIESISILRPTHPKRNEHKKIKEFFGKNEIHFSEFLKPDDQHLFNDYEYEFKIKVNKTENVVIINKLHDQSDSTPTQPKIEYSSGKLSSFQFIKSNWVIAPYKNERLKIDSYVFEFQTTDESEFQTPDKSELKDTSIKRHILFYDGTLSTEHSVKPTNASKKRFEDVIDENIKGPFKVFYQIHFSNKVELKNFQKKLTDKTIDPEQKPDGPVSKMCDLKYYPLSESCPEDFQWDESIKRCILRDQSHQSILITCNNETGCSNIFDKPLFQSRLYRPHSGKILQEPNFPEFGKLNITKMFFPIGKKNRIALKFQQNDAQKDFCVQFKHFGYKTKLLAGVESMPEYDFEFNDDQLSMKDNLYNEDSICVSNLTTQIQSTDSIVLMFENPDLALNPIGQSVASFVPVKGVGLDCLNGTMQDEDKKHVLLPDSKNDDFFQITEKIQFTFPRSKANQATKQEGFRRILTTKFIKLLPFNSTEHQPSKMINIGFKYDGDFLNYGGDVWLQFRPKSKSDYNIKKLKSEAVNQLIYEPKTSDSAVEEVQVQFVFQIKNISEMKELMELNNKDKVEFSIEKLSINDPCVGETNSLTDFCSGLQNACQRSFDPEFGHTCNCSSDQTYRSGDECEIVDYCKKENKTEFCKKKNAQCVIDPDMKTWICTCPKGQIWIPVGEYCSEKIELDCKGGEIIEVNNNGQPQCVCPDGQVHIGDGDAKKCVEYDVCNLAHREANKDSPRIPCEDVNAECKKISSSSYECVCQGDKMNADGNFSSEAYCLDRLCQLNLKCQQECSLRVFGKTECLCYENYNRIAENDDDHNCQIKDEFKSKEQDCLPSKDIDNLSIFERAYLGLDNKCACKLTGYEFNPTSKKCESNGKDPVRTELHCDHIKKLRDGKTKLVGPKGKKYDHVYGECRYEDCTQPDQITFVEDEENSQCLSVCDPLMFVGCADEFARCNSTKVMEQMRKSKNLPENETLIFFRGKDPIINESAVLCDCIEGFTQGADEKCILDTNRKMFQINIQFDPVINGKTVVEKYFLQILQYFFQERRKEYGTLDETPYMNANCDDCSNCTAFIAATALKPKIVEDFLDYHCIDENYLKKTDESQNCIYLLRKDPEHFVFALTRTKNGSVYSEFDRCFSKPCEHFKHRNCRMNKQNPYEFSCGCDGFYKNSKQKILDSPEIYQCDLKTCEENNIHCKDETAKCEMFEPHDGYGIDEAMAKCFEETNDFKSYFASFGPFRDEPFPACLCPNGEVVINIHEYCPK